MQLPPEINKDAALCLALKNTAKPEHSAVESNRIGLQRAVHGIWSGWWKSCSFPDRYVLRVTLSFPVTAP